MREGVIATHSSELRSSSDGGTGGEMREEVDDVKVFKDPDEGGGGR